MSVCLDVNTEVYVFEYKSLRTLTRSYFAGQRAEVIV